MQLLYYLEEGEFLSQEVQKKFWALGENWTHDPPSSSLEAPTTEPMEALWGAGSKFNYYYMYTDSDVFILLFSIFYLRS